MEKNIYAIPFSITLAATATGCIVDSEKPEEITTTTIEPNNYCLAVPSDEKLAPYQAVMDTIPKLKEIINFCKYSESNIQEMVWDKIREAEETGLPPTAPLPGAYVELLQNNLAAVQMQAQSLPYFPSEHFLAEYNVREWRNGKLEEKIEVLSMDAESPVTKIFLTKEEAHEIYAAHLAHSLWLEKNQIVPWSLQEYSEEQLEQLVTPKALFYSWSDQQEIYTYSLLVNHSPREAFLIAREMAASSSNQKEALVGIIKGLRSYVHGTFNVDSQEIITVQGMSEEKISRHGCQTSALLVVHLAKSLNIPGRYIIGYYAGGGHRSGLFEFNDQVLAHGDDLYNRLVSNTPSAELLDSYAFWQNEVMSHEKADPQGAHNSMIHNYENGKKYPSWIVLKSYCAEGKAALEDIFLNTDQGDFATAEELQTLGRKITNITERCTVFPEDNPDK